MKYRKTAYLGLLTAFACILSYVETLIPFYFGIPGMKLGLTNAAILTALYWFGAREALYLSGIRILLLAMLFGNFYSMAFSIAGALLSFAVMAGLKRFSGLSMAGVSIAGGCAHNLGQMIIASWLYITSGFVYYLPVLLAGGAVTGLLIGLIGQEVVKRVRI